MGWCLGLLTEQMLDGKMEHLMERGMVCLLGRSLEKMLDLQMDCVRVLTKVHLLER